MAKRRPKIKFSAFVASTIDGRISHGPEAKIDWTSKEDWMFFQRSLAKFDAVVVGSNTYRLAKKNLDKRNTIVFTGKTAKQKGTVIFLDPKKTDVRKVLRNKLYKKVAILGGPQIYSYFLEHKMLDEIYLTIEPLVATAGVPMFTGARWQQYNFKLHSIKRLNKKGTLLLKYIYAN